MDKSILNDYLKDPEVLATIELLKSVQVSTPIKYIEDLYDTSSADNCGDDNILKKYITCVLQIRYLVEKLYLIFKNRKDIFRIGPDKIILYSYDNSDSNLTTLYFFEQGKNSFANSININIPSYYTYVSDQGSPDVEDVYIILHTDFEHPIKIKVKDFCPKSINDYFELVK